VQKLLNGLPGVFLQATLTEGIAGSRVSCLKHDNTKCSHQVEQVVRERLADAMADQRFRSKMAQVAAICGMDEFDYDDDDDAKQRMCA
jgi:hypothetical protein